MFVAFYMSFSHFCFCFRSLNSNLVTCNFSHFSHFSHFNHLFHDLVPHYRYFLRGFPHSADPFQPVRMDMEEDKAAQSDCPSSDRSIMADTGIDSRHPRVLSSYRLAFQRTLPAGGERAAHFIHQVSYRQAYRG
jgi:hypothetical protein